MKILYNKQRIRRNNRKMSKLKKILLSLMIMGTTVSWAKEFKIMTYNIYGGRLTNGQKLGKALSRMGLILCRFKKLISIRKEVIFGI